MTRAQRQAAMVSRSDPSNPARSAVMDRRSSRHGRVSPSRRTGGRSRAPTVLVEGARGAVAWVDSAKKHRPGGGSRMVSPGLCAPHAARETSTPAMSAAARWGDGSVLLGLDRRCGRAVRSTDSEEEGVGNHFLWSLRMRLGVAATLSSACSSDSARPSSGSRA